MVGGWSGVIAVVVVVVVGGVVGMRCEVSGVECGVRKCLGGVTRLKNTAKSFEEKQRKGEREKERKTKLAQHETSKTVERQQKLAE